MTDVSKGDYPDQSVVHMIPIIDLDPTDMSCIYSTLLFVIKQAEELNIRLTIMAESHGDCESPRLGGSPHPWRISYFDELRW